MKVFFRGAGISGMMIHAGEAIGLLTVFMLDPGAGGEEGRGYRHKTTRACALALDKCTMALSLIVEYSPECH